MEKNIDYLLPYLGIIFVIGFGWFAYWFTRDGVFSNKEGIPGRDGSYWDPIPGHPIGSSSGTSYNSDDGSEFILSLVLWGASILFLAGIVFLVIRFVRWAWYF